MKVEFYCEVFSFVSSIGWRKSCNCDANLLKGSHFSQFRYRLTIISALKIMSVVTQIENHWLTHPYLITILYYYDLVKYCVNYFVNLHSVFVRFNILVLHPVCFVAELRRVIRRIVPSFLLLIVDHHTACEVKEDQLLNIKKRRRLLVIQTLRWQI